VGAVSKYIRIEAPARQVYDLWRDPSRFPDFMADVKQVEARGDRWHWKVDGPGGVPVEWESQVIEDVPSEKIAWKSVNGMENAGAVRFDDRGDVTDMEYTIEFSPPGGKAGDVVAKIFDDPEKKARVALAAFKELVERDAKPRIDGRTGVVDAGEAAPPSAAA
jgi:uncharacterized membrane protein